MGRNDIAYTFVAGHEGRLSNDLDCDKKKQRKWFTKGFCISSIFLVMAHIIF